MPKVDINRHIDQPDKIQKDLFSSLVGTRYILNDLCSEKDKPEEHQIEFSVLSHSTENRSAHSEGDNQGDTFKHNSESATASAE